MTIALSQSTSREGGLTNPLPLKFPNATSTGNCIVVAATWGAANNTGIAVTDTAGNSYVTALTIADATDVQSIGVWYALNTTGVSVNTVNLSDNGNDFLGLVAHEYSGVLSASASDGTSSAQATGTAVSSGTITTTANNDLLFGFVANTGGPGTFSVKNSFTTRENMNALTIPIVSSDSLQGTAGAVSAMWTLSASNAYGAGLLTLKAAAAGAVSDDVLIRYGSMDATSGSGLVTAVFASTAPTAVAGGGLLPWYYEEIVQDGV